MIDLEQVRATFSQLHDYIAGESRLREFVPGAKVLLEQAHALVRGSREILPVAGPVPPAHIPDRELARAIVHIMASLPTLDGDEEPGLAAAYARLIGNLADGLTVSIYRSYPEVVPRTPTAPSDDDAK